MDLSGAVAIYALLVITIPSALAGATIYLGKYNKGLSKRVEAQDETIEKQQGEIQELRDRDGKNYEEMRRLRKENDTLTEMVTGTKQLEEIVSVLRNHDAEAYKRHLAMMAELSAIKAAQDARDKGV